MELRLLPHPQPSVVSPVSVGRHGGTGDSSFGLWGGQLRDSVRQETEGGRLVRRPPGAISGWRECPLSSWCREGTSPWQFDLLLSGARSGVWAPSLDLVFLKGLSFRMVSFPKWRILGRHDPVSCDTSPSSAWGYSEHSTGCSRSGHAELGRVRCPTLTLFTLLVLGRSKRGVSHASSQVFDAVLPRAERGAHSFRVPSARPCSAWRLAPPGASTGHAASPACQPSAAHTQPDALTSFSILCFEGKGMRV